MTDNPAGPDEQGTPAPDRSPAAPGSADPTAPPPDQPFDPYRFGAPEHPVPPEYAPPGYVPPAAPGQPGAGSYPGQAAPQSPSYGTQPPYPPPAQPGYSPPGQSPYPPPYAPYAPGQSPYPPGQSAPFPGYATPRPGHGKAVAALVLGICSIVFFWTTFFDLLLIIPALVFGFIALSEARAGSGSARGMARAGLICTAIGTILALAFTIFALYRVNHCTDLYGSSGPGYDHCIRQL